MWLFIALLLYCFTCNFQYFIHMKIFTSKSQQIGERGEDETCKFLANKGFKVVERNYTKKWGELDIIAEKANVLHFIEVKSITIKDKISREISFSPEDNMHSWKVKRLQRALETYLMEREVDEDKEWQFDLVCVYFTGNTVRVEILEDIVLG